MRVRGWRFGVDRPGRLWPGGLSTPRPRRSGLAAAAALGQLGFELTDEKEAEIRRGKDFIQLKNGPFDLDLIFAPDGILDFNRAWSRRVEVEGFPVCHLAA